MRVISGKAKGLVLKTLIGDSTRPTKDMVREALYNILVYKVVDCIFLDLFAGSGAVGIEAISRGADKCYFCDNNIDAIDIINWNLNKAKMSDKAVVMNGNYVSILDKLKSKKFDIIFIDPPYNKGIGVSAMEIISEYDMLFDDGLIIYETDQIEIIPSRIGKYKRYDCRKYGRNVLNFYKIEC